MQDISNLQLMHKDKIIAKIHSNVLDVLEPSLMPYFLERTGDIISWLSSRAIDSHRTNSRLLKCALRLESEEDLEAVLYVNAVTIADNYWVKRQDETLSYKDVSFKMNMFDKLALYGDNSSLFYRPMPTPELTNIGSFEKCWTRKDGIWYMFKAGTPHEQFSEVFAYKAGLYLGYNMTEYKLNYDYVVSSDFTKDGKYDFDPAFGFIGDETDYIKIYERLKELCPKAAKEYVCMCYLDALIYNFDRHEHDFGVLRDSDNGKPLQLAPLFDHNLSLIARGYRQSEAPANDILIQDFVKLLRHTGEKISIRKFDKETLTKICRSIPIVFPLEDGIHKPRSFVVDFILERQTSLLEKCKDLIKVKEAEPT